MPKPACPTQRRRLSFLLGAVLAVAGVACSGSGEPSGEGAAAGAGDSAAGAEGSAAGAEFLSENAQRDGVVVLPSGLQYEVLEEGSGPSPSATDDVTIHYVGTLVDGTEFDSSRARGTPATFNLAGVIGGFREGLQLMSVGARYKLYVPPELGYGPTGQGPIPPNAALIFEVELLGIGGS